MAFRTCRGQRFEFRAQQVADFQDEEDRNAYLRECRVVSAYRDVSSVVDIGAEAEAPEAVRKVAKRRKVRMSYGEDEDEQEGPGQAQGGLQIKVKSIDSKIKFISEAKPAKVDPVYTRFVKTVVPGVRRSKIPEQFEFAYSQQPSLAEQARMQLSSRFTSDSVSPSLPGARAVCRTVVPITVDPVIAKRLNL